MKTPCSILAIFDPTGVDQPAVEKAAILATKFGSRLEIFACDVGAEAANSALINEDVNRARSQLKAECQSRLETLAKEHRGRGLDVSTDWAAANLLHEGLIRKIASYNPDLVVKETHHHSIIKRTIITNTDWHLLRDCSVPVLLVKAKPWSPQMRILACVDPGHHADVAATFDHEILAWSTSLRTALGGQLHVLHSYIPEVLATAAVSAGTPAVGGELMQEMIDTEQTARASAILSMVNPYGMEQANVHVQLGSPTDSIPAAAHELHMDLVVMGTISRTALKRILIGSTAERVLDRLACDVLAVKPLDFAADLPF